MAGVGKYYFIVNESDHDLQQDYCGVAYILLAGKAAKTPWADEKDEGEQFEEEQAKAFKSCFPKDVKQFIKLDRRNNEVPPDEQKSYVDAFPEAEKPYPNKDGENFPEGEPSLGWDAKQLKAYFKKYDQALYKKVRSHHPPSVLWEWWCEKNTPEAFEEYKLATQRHREG